jgi:hypothetical protein
LVITNNGSGTATGVVITDALPGSLVYVAGSASPEPSQVAPLVWRPGPLAPGASLTISFVARLSDSAATSVRNIAVVGDSATEIIDTSENIVLRTPTAITLQGFHAIRQAGGVQLSWSTSLERNTLGFYILRGAGPDRAGARQLGTELVPARGAGTYERTDATGADSDYYWLVEVDLSGKSSEYGPIRVTPPQTQTAKTHRLYIPMGWRSP